MIHLRGLLLPLAICCCLMASSSLAVDKEESKLRSLNKWLEDKVESESGEDNYNYAAHKLRHSKTFRLFKGSFIEMIEMLKKVGDAKECNSDVFDTLVRLSKYDINFKFGRINKVLEFHMKRLGPDCAGKLEQQFKQSQAQLDRAKVDKLFEALSTDLIAFHSAMKRPDGDIYKVGTEYVMDHSFLSNIGRHLRTMSGKQWDPSKSNIHEFSREMDTEFQLRVAEPCKYYMSVVGKVYEHAEVVTRRYAPIDGKTLSTIREKVEDFPKEFFDGVFYWNRCRNLVELKNVEDLVRKSL